MPGHLCQQPAVEHCVLWTRGAWTGRGVHLPGVLEARSPVQCGPRYEVGDQEVGQDLRGEETLGDGSIPPALHKVEAEAHLQVKCPFGGICVSCRERALTIPALSAS